MRINKSKILKINKLPLIFNLLVIIMGTMGVTYALFSSQKSYENKFEVGKPDVVLTEEFPSPNLRQDRETEKKVYVENKGTADMVIRVLISETWTKTLEDDTKIILNNQIDNENVIEKNWTEDFLNNWILKDGYYYYKKVLNGGEKIQLLNSIQFKNKFMVEDSDYTGLNTEYDLGFYVESVQATTSAINELWGITPTIEGSDVNWPF